MNTYYIHIYIDTHIYIYAATEDVCIYACMYVRMSFCILSYFCMRVCMWEEHILGICEDHVGSGAEVEHGA